VAYHTLFFTHLYLQREEAAFQLWAQHRGPGDGIEGDPYTQLQVLEYWSFCDRIVDDAVDALDLDSAESGFSWYRMSKLEHQFVNIRHIQHHGAPERGPRVLILVSGRAAVGDNLGSSHGPQK